MNRRTFMQAISTALAVALVPAVAHATDLDAQVEAYWQDAAAIVSRFPNIALAYIDGNGRGLERKGDEWWLRLSTVGGGEPVKGLACITAGQIRENTKPRANWRAEVEGLCEVLTLAEADRRPPLFSWSQTYRAGDVVRFPKGDLAMITKVHHVGGYRGYSIASYHGPMQAGKSCA